MELEVEVDQLREQAARQNAIVSSLKKRIQVTFRSRLLSKSIIFIFSSRSLKAFLTALPIFINTQFFPLIIQLIMNNFIMHQTDNVRAIASPIFKKSQGLTRCIHASANFKGIGRTREDSVRDSRQKRDHDTGFAEGLEVSRGKGARMRQEDMSAGADSVRRDTVERACSIKLAGSISSSPILKASPFAVGVSMVTFRCFFDEGIHSKAGTRVERRVPRNRSSKSGDGNPEDGRAGSGDESCSREMQQPRGAVVHDRDGSPKLSGCFGPRGRGEGSASTTNVLANG